MLDTEISSRARMPPSLIARGEGGGAFYNGARVISRLADNSDPRERIDRKRTGRRRRRRAVHVRKQSSGRLEHASGGRGVLPWFRFGEMKEEDVVLCASCVLRSVSSRVRPPSRVVSSLSAS